MSSKCLVLGGVVVVFCLCASARALQDASAVVPKQIKYEAITIKRNHPKVAFQGRISAAQYKKWFKSDYAVSGERIEIPKDATLFGTLVLTDGAEIVVLPFYQWGDEKHFRCQGFKFGRAPMFAAFGDSERVFLGDLKKTLESLK